MCAIAGIWNREMSEAALTGHAKAMADVLKHRGPDDEGIWVDVQNRIALAHRRLAIIDLSPAGHQPMVSRCGRFVIVFNGECYNYVELQADLESRGVVLRGRSDTEVILEAMADFGIEATLKRMAGMFALALWDKAEGTLTLIRDRIGKKPLYYGAVGGTFLFASELKAFHSVPGKSLSLNRSALAVFFRLGYIPAPMTIFNEVQKLPAGHIITIKSPTAVGASVPYWSVGQAARSARFPSRAVADEQAIQDLDVLLRQSVRERMISDVPLGAFLSGGIDSSLVVALMQAQSSRRVRTFSIAFQEPEYNEGPHALAVAAHLRTDHTELVVAAADALETIPRLPEIYDEPFADVSQIPTCLLARLTRQHVTVSLSGDGGDELFQGYAHYEQAAQRVRRMLAFPSPCRSAVGGLLGAVPERALDAMCRMASGAARSRQIRLRGHYVHKYANALAQKTALGMYLAIIADSAKSGTVLRQAECDDNSAIEHAMAVDSLDLIELFGLSDLALYMPEDILVKVDRASMAYGLEARAPLLDHRVVEFALGLPVNLKRRNGVGKWLLRQLLYEYVPQEMVDRPKQGFAVPIGDWLRGPLREWAEEMLEPRKMRQRGLLNTDFVQRTWQEHVTAQHNWERLLWNVIVLQAWLQRWMKS